MFSNLKYPAFTPLAVLGTFVISSGFNAAAADDLQWTAMEGMVSIGAQAIYGQQGVTSPQNRPGVREGAASWIDGSGDLWMYGGINYDGRPAGLMSNRRLSDLWKYDTSSGQWTWMDGSSAIAQFPVHGTIGVSAPANTPGNRSHAATWIDTTGNFWMFGGESAFYHNDLWMYSPVSGNWTWVKGSSSTNQPGVYGTKGVPAPGNTPSARLSAATWTDSSGNFWLFGGYRSESAGPDYNDLWKFDTVAQTWTWVSGSNSPGENSVIGTVGVPAPENVPGARYGTISWIDGSGDLWLFGGRSGRFVYNDLWKYDVSADLWTCVSENGDPEGIYGFYQTPSAAHLPAARHGANAWVDDDGMFWMFGGETVDPFEDEFYLNDLWKYDPTTGFWAWMNGTSRKGAPGYVGPQGVFDGFHTPGGRLGSVAWADGEGKVWLFGGHGHDGAIGYGGLNDLWQLDLGSVEWAWISGADYIYQRPVYGFRTMGTELTIPAARLGSSTWVDGSGDLWLFGGEGRTWNLGRGFHNDLWKYDIETGVWSWMNGYATGQADQAVSGKGLSPSFDTPTPRWSASSWTDSNGMMWLFGGQDDNTDFTFEDGYLNDLWRFDPALNQWTKISGSTIIDPPGIYGTQGVAATGNIPGGRYRSVSWIDQADNLWLFGGEGLDSEGDVGLLNDLWKFDPVTENWTWVKGSNTRGNSGSLGTQGVPAATNSPKAGSRAVSWVDDAGKFWMFGGATPLSSQALWQFDTATGNWTWMSGDGNLEKMGVYGTKGIAAPGNIPGSRYYAVSWVEAGRLWMFGGIGRDRYFNIGMLNDLWYYDINTGQWTWVKGSDTVFPPGICETFGTPSAENTPGGRYNMVSWKNHPDAFWIFGGYGIDCEAYRTDLGDLWRGEPGEYNSAAPANWSLYE